MSGIKITESNTFSFGKAKESLLTESSIEVPDKVEIEVPEVTVKPVEASKVETKDSAPKEKKSCEIENISLKDYSVKKIVDTSFLDPMVVFTLVANKGNINTIGIPGFFDAANDRFMLLDGSPVSAEGFDEEFSKYLKGLREALDEKS